MLRPNSSNGCITLNNNDLEKLEPYLGVNDTPIIISETLLDPQLGSAVEIEKNSRHFQEILRALSFSPEEFPTEDITTLFFIRNGAQAIADIYYYKYIEQYTRYHMHKRVYLNPTSTHNWPNVHTTEVKAGIPMILALHPIKSLHKRENLE